MLHCYGKINYLTHYYYYYCYFIVIIILNCTSARCRMSHCAPTRQEKSRKDRKGKEIKRLGRERDKGMGLVGEERWDGTD